MSRTKAAWILAIVADALQIVLMPALGEGFASPAMDALDLIVAIGMIVLLGWHVAFLPTAIAEVIPAFNLFPTWTAAVFFVTRKRRSALEAERAGGGAALDDDARRKELPPGAR
jgi:hypothetical protein